MNLFFLFIGFFLLALIAGAVWTLDDAMTGIIRSRVTGTLTIIGLIGMVTTMILGALLF